MNGFSLSIAGKKEPRRGNVQGSDAKDKVHREDLTGFGEEGLQPASLQTSSGAPKIIAKQENSFQVGKFKPSYVPESANALETDNIDKFETAAHDTAVAQQQVTYGLIQRSKPSASDKKSSAPISIQERETEQFLEDLKTLPPEADLDAYEAMPIESFGEALLRGMGWSEGRAIGRNAKAEEVVAKEVVRRPQRLGLGAAPAPPPTQKKYIKPGETRETQDMVYMDKDGHVKATKPVNEKLVDRKKLGIQPGKVMYVVDGRHKGLKCEIVSLEPQKEGRSERVRVRLLPSYESVSLRCSEVSDNRSKDDSKKRRRDEEDEPEEKPWLVPNIRVKIIDKRLAGGKLYLKKGTIVDVKTPTVCDVYVDELKESYLDIDQRKLETAVPSTEGTPVLILLGKLKGRKAKLLQRNTTTGLAAVQLVGDLSVHKVSLDDIAEYAGAIDTWND